MAARDYGQYCGVTRAVEIVGERWALLIIRDLLVGPRRYGELAAGLPRIPSNILAARLKELQAAGVIRRAVSTSLIGTSSSFQEIPYWSIEPRRDVFLNAGKRWCRDGTSFSRRPDLALDTRGG